MKSDFRKRFVFLATVFVSLALTTTSLAEVTIVNVYHVDARAVTPTVHISRGISNTSTLKVGIDSTGSHAYVNMTEYFQLSGQNYVNITDLFALTSTTTTTFGYLSNITLFNGQKTVQTVNLYSYGSNGSYSSDYNFTSAGTYSNNTNPVLITGAGSSPFGLYIQLGKTGYAGPYTWHLDFEINGFYNSNGNIPSVYTQYFVDIQVTTLEIA